MAINLGSMMGNRSGEVVNALNLQKNQILDLTKKNPGLEKVVLGAGWDIAKNGYDLRTAGKSNAKRI